MARELKYTLLSRVVKRLYTLYRRQNSKWNDPVGCISLLALLFGMLSSSHGECMDAPTLRLGNESLFNSEMTCESSMSRGRTNSSSPHSRQSVLFTYLLTWLIITVILGILNNPIYF